MKVKLVIYCVGIALNAINAVQAESVSSNEACWTHAQHRNYDNPVRKIQKSDETSA